MTPIEIENAQVTHVFIGVEDHGLAAISIATKAGCASQSYGYFSLKGIDMAGAIKQLTLVLETDDITVARGKFIRVQREDGLIRRIGHIVEDHWFDIRDYYTKAVSK